MRPIQLRFLNISVHRCCGLTGQEKSYGAANLSQPPMYTGTHVISICALYKVDISPVLQSLL